MSQEARNILLGSGVTPRAFPTHVPDADFNFSLLLATSNVINRLGTFQTELVKFFTLAPSGHPSQLVKLVPQEPIMAHSPLVDGLVQPMSYTKASSRTIGMGITFAYYVTKIGALQNDEYTSWCCVKNAPAANVVDVNGINNRNADKIFPIQYAANTFKTGDRYGLSFRSGVINS